MSPKCALPPCKQKPKSPGLSDFGKLVIFLVGILMKYMA